MSLPLLNCMGHTTDDQGGPFVCPERVCGGSPDAMTLGEDRVWVCDTCGKRVLSWRLSEEHTKET